MEQAQLRNFQSGFATFAAFEKDQIVFGIGAVAHKAKLLGLQACLGCAGADLRQVLRFMYQIEITAVAQCIGCGSAKIFGGAMILAAGGAVLHAGRAADEIRGVGKANIKASGGDMLAQTANVTAYTYHA